MPFLQTSAFRSVIVGLFISLSLCLGIVFFFGNDGLSSLSVSMRGFLGTSVSPRALFIGTQRYDLETVDTDAERRKGLGGRESLCENCGMLFVFETPSRYAFWMKDMRFPLDIIWLSGETVVFVARDIQPDFLGVIDPTASADRVLEINASRGVNAHVGDILRFVY